MIGTGGLTAVPTEVLRELFRMVHRGTLPVPITRMGLATTQPGLLRVADDLELLHDLDRKAVVAVLTAVLAERDRRR